MLTLFTLSTLTILSSASHVYLLPVVSLCLLIYYLLNLSIPINSSILSIFGDTIYDELGLVITLLTFFIMLVSFVYAISFGNHKLIALTLVFLLFFCVQVFNTDSIFYLYFFYESSLVPILFIIVK